MWSSSMAFDNNHQTFEIWMHINDQPTHYIIKPPFVISPLWYFCGFLLFYFSSLILFLLPCIKHQSVLCFQSAPSSSWTSICGRTPRHRKSSAWWEMWTCSWPTPVTSRWPSWRSWSLVTHPLSYTVLKYRHAYCVICLEVDDRSLIRNVSRLYVILVYF